MRLCRTFFNKVRVFFVLENPDCRIFFGPKKVLPARAIRLFCTKTGLAGKITTEQNKDSMLYIRYPGNYPVTGWLPHILFRAENFFAGFFPI